MRYLLIFSLSLLFSCKNILSQESSESKVTITSFKNVKIFEQKRGKSLGPSEPSIFINPTNTNNIVVGSIINFYHTSVDGGKTWQTNQIKSTMGVWGDPCITADTKGNFYYAHLSDPEGTNWRSKRILDRMVVQKSTDGGKTWSDGVGVGLNVPKQQDKEWLTVNPFNNEIYITWTEFDKYNSKNPEDKSRILFSKSADDGLTWRKPVKLSQFEGNALDDDKTTEGAVPSVGPNGAIYVAWSYDNKIYFDKSTDGGLTWLDKDIVATDQPGGWNFDLPGLNRTNGMPVTGVDISENKYKGTVYINFSDQRNGTDNTDVFIVKSDDKGITWSKPIKVNQDTTKTHQFLTWMSVDPKTGYLYIVYYDRSKYTNNFTDVVLAVSTDGGANFSNTTISESPFEPNTQLFFGDYLNISSFNGVVRPVWTRIDKDTLSIWTALIDVK
ncbi:MAG: glycoside hydrolase [Flavobacteriaceae bacterium]|nr:glycoside hydrolase [Flavobacteriaceae bacterium]